MLNFLCDHGVLHFLSGFFPGDSTSIILLVIYYIFYKALDEGKYFHAVILFIRKAFDRIWHKGLIYKL